jgi:glycosyltransferase involved in cell wall biosynthesis
MRFSLCVICGNESQHILAMLESFAPAFDELSLVRAIGKREPDDTVQQAREWCQANGKDFIFAEHLNEIEARDWDHVDSFAKARNAAFRQATGDWLFWADCDDVVSGIETLRARLESAPAEVTMARFLYDVKGSGKQLFRERAIRRESFHAGRVWHHDVHENLLLIPGDKHDDLPGVVWIHAPREVKKENRRRNLRILANSAKECATQYFYIHQEHFCLRNLPAAEQFGKLALSFPNLQASFRYETLLNLARISSNRREAMTYCLEAHGVFPWCREALTAIIMLFFERNDGKMARWWADQMLLLREPLEAERPWTHEQKWYEWAGYDLAARAFRLDGNHARADVLQWQFHLGATPRISLLHSTRGRSSQAVNCRETWLNLAADPTQVEHIFAVDSDDKESVQMSRQFVSVVSDKRSCVAAWNLAARKARGDLLVQLSDDWLPTKDWDRKLLAAVAGRDLQKEPLVIAVNDGTRKDDLLCMAICSRARLEQQGGDLFFPGYESVFSDNEFSVRAFKEGVVVDARDRITFEHVHPAFGKAAMDATYRHNNTALRYADGEKLFKERNP